MEFAFWGLQGQGPSCNSVLSSHPGSGKGNLGKH